MSTVPSKSWTPIKLLYCTLLFTACLLKGYCIIYITTRWYSGKPLVIEVYSHNDLRTLMSSSEERRILTPIEETVHYGLDSASGDLEWKELLPNGGMIFLGEDKQPASIAMFHQLRCLDTIRSEVVHFHGRIDSSPLAEEHQLTRHCFNYLRQLIICRGNTVYAAAFERPPGVNDLYECKDWRGIYEKVYALDMLKA